MLHPITVSTASPNILPTTGIKFETAALVVFAVIPSTVLLKLPSTEIIPTNKVSTTPNVHTTVELKNFDSLSTWILLDTFEIIANAVDISTNGSKIVIIKLPMKVIINNIIGSNIPADAKLPVVSIKVISSGTRLFINPTKFWILVFTIWRISEKFAIIKVTIKIYWT